MTPLHARPKEYRNLYNAKRVTNREETEAFLEREFDRETIKMVSDAHKDVWKRRGRKKPPYVSKRYVGVFDIDENFS